MARIKKDNRSWHASGIIKRDYKHDGSKPSDNVMHKTRKDKKRWCGAHINREHKLYRTYWQSSWDYTYHKDWIETRCEACSKRFSRVSSPNTPLRIPIDFDEYEKALPIQVKVNGKALVIDWQKYDKICVFCGYAH